MARLESVSRLVCKARKIGTPDPVVIASVLAKRAVFKLRSSLPYKGARNNQVCQRKRVAGFFNALRQTHSKQPKMIKTIQPSLRTKFDTASINTVSSGNFCLVLANTDTICGTT